MGETRRSLADGVQSADYDRWVSGNVARKSDCRRCIAREPALRGAGADAGRVLQGQAGQPLYRLLRRRRLRSLCAHAGAAHGQAYSRNAQVVPKNMDGAGSLRASNFIYQAAPRDGTAFGASGRATPMSPLFGQSAAQFDARKYTWLGSANDEVSRASPRRRPASPNSTICAKPKNRSARPVRPRKAFRSSRPRTRCSERKSRSSLVIPAATRSIWRWSAARSTAAARNLLVEHQVDHAATRRSEEDHDPLTGRVRQASGIARCAAAVGFRDHR